MGKRAYRVKDGEPFIVKRRGHTMICCDCGLAHKMDFDVVKLTRARVGYRRVVRQVPGLNVVVRAWRAPQITGGVRSHKGRR